MPTRALISLVVLLLLLTGCGGGGGGKSSNGLASKTPEEVLAAIRAAVTSAKSVHVIGSGTSDGQAMKLDLRLATDSGQGSMTVQGLSFELIRIGDKAYIKGDEAFWRNIGQEAAGKLVGDRWLLVSTTDSNFAGLLQLTDINQMVNGVLEDHGELKNEGETTVDGQSAVRIVDTTEGGTLFVAATGPAYPVKLDSKDEGSISFSEWDESFDVEAPEDVIDINELDRN
jgi:hypothetical protein